MIKQQSIYMLWFKQCILLKLNNLCSQSPNNCNSTHSQQSLSKSSTYSIIIQSSMIASTQSIFLEQMASIEHRERQGLNVSPPNLFISGIMSTKITHDHLYSTGYMCLDLSLPHNACQLKNKQSGIGMNINDSCIKVNTKK